MRKTSTFARKKLRNQVHTKQADAAMRVFQRCSEYSEEAGTLGQARLNKLKMREALTDLRNGSASDERPFNLMAHAINIAYIRALEIRGVHNNPMIPLLEKAESALTRCRDRKIAHGVWRLDGPGMSDLTEGVELYETILSASSPQQMINASHIREKALRRQKSASGA